MSNFLGRNKGKAKREKAVIVDWTSDYLDPERLKQKYIERSKNTWSDCEYLYSARCLRCSKRSTSAAGSVDAEAILALFFLPADTAVGVASFEYNQSVELSVHERLDNIHKVTNDEARSEFSFSAGESEYTWKMNSHAERDEFVWILCQLSKNMTGIGVPVSGYVPELDLGSFESKSPVLFRLLSSDVAGSVQGEEEKEAEALLERLDWTKPVPELQAKLHEDIVLLNVEICDLLLQWEDDEAVPGSSENSSSRVRDTVELLTTLNHVDKELGFVDDWLGNQIDHLSEVQSEIKQIESESGTLETSLQNLTSVKSLISSVTKNLYFSRTNEDILGRADKNLKTLLGSGSMLPEEVDRVVDPIIAALSDLRNALATNEDSLYGAECSREDWDHLKLVSGIMEQRQKLSGIVFKFCSTAGEYLASLFSSILRHKALNDLSRESSVLVRKYSFSTAQFEALVCSGRAAPSLPVEARLVAMEEKNQLLSAQRCFHQSLFSFLPILEHAVFLNPVLKFQIIKSYIDSAQQYLYGPLLRQLFKEVALVTSAQHVVCFGSLPRAKANRAGSKLGALQRFHEVCASISSSSLTGKSSVNSSPGVTSLHVWDSMLLLVLVIAPVVAREELFFEGLVPDVDSSLDTDHEADAASMEELFSSFRERVLKIVSSPDQVCALELLAVLVFVESVLKFQAIVSMPREAASLEDNIIDVGMYSFPSSFRIPRFVLTVLGEARGILSERLDQFIADEVNWIQSGKGGLTDTKMLGVFPVFSKFPVLLDIVEELTGSQAFSFAEKLILTLGSQLLNWLYSSAALNEKYHDAILIQNLAFFELTLNSRAVYSSYPVLSVLLEESNGKRFEAEKRYLDWMISYEMPSFANLSTKIEGVEKRANRDELSLYVRRQDVIKVISGLDLKSVETSIIVIRKRLDKHFNTAEAVELELIPRMWTALEDRMHSMFVSMADIVQASYQLSMSLKPDALCAIFDKHKK